ncbi:hypothetical protein CSQ89_16185, partial [Chitinimonas sp. BJB300]
PHSLLAPFVLFLPRQLASVFFVHFYQLGADTNKSTLSCRVNKIGKLQLRQDYARQVKANMFSCPHLSFGSPNCCATPTLHVSDSLLAAIRRRATIDLC